MQYTELKASCSRNMVTGESWWKFEPTVSLAPGEDIFEAAKQMKVDINKMLSHGEISVDYSAIPGHPMQTQETRTEEQVTRDQQIEGYYEIINMAKTKPQLERHWGNIEKLKDLELVTAYNNKLNSLT